MVLISLPSEGHTAKSVSEADIKKIDDIMQTAVNGARQRLRDLGGPISPRLRLSTRLMSRRLRPSGDTRSVREISADDRIQA